MSRVWAWHGRLAHAFHGRPARGSSTRKSGLHNLGRPALLSSGWRNTVLSVQKLLVIRDDDPPAQAKGWEGSGEGGLHNPKSTIREAPTEPDARQIVTPIMLSLIPALLIAASAPQDAAPPKPKTVKVAAIQCSSMMADPSANRKKLIALVEEAAKNGAKIVVLPEASITGYLSQDLKTNWRLDGWPMEPVYAKGLDPKTHAEQVPGPSTKAFGELAKRLGIYVTVPFVEVVPSTNQEIPKYYNTVCLASPKGEIVAHYRKLTPWPYPEKSWASPGDLGVQTYDTEYGRVGLAICFDIHTILEKLKPKQIWALLYPIAWVSDSHPADWFWHLLPARIKPYKHYVVGANWSVDSPQPWFGYGFSTIYGPEGEILATSHSLYGSEIVYGELKVATP
ncbi:MAG: carbon-nitrogen hydrolase family protein [Fimbriimonadaceae bacterium]|nr:carbon-nitrogen hydrolase family protein [Fimbriimonadaceae bacterium]